jgi:hypothetical protein
LGIPGLGADANSVLCKFGMLGAAANPKGIGQFAAKRAGKELAEEIGGSAAKGRRTLPRIAGGAPKPDEILRPGGAPIGRPGTSPGIREVSTREELDDLFEQLRIHGSPTSSKYPGTGIDLEGGGFLGLRQSGRHGPTLDVNIPGVRDVRKIHVRP